MIQIEINFNLIDLDTWTYCGLRSCWLLGAAQVLIYWNRLKYDNARYFTKKKIIARSSGLRGGQEHLTDFESNLALEILMFSRRPSNISNSIICIYLIFMCLVFLLVRRPCRGQRKQFIAFKSKMRTYSEFMWVAEYTIDMNDLSAFYAKAFAIFCAFQFCSRVFIIWNFAQASTVFRFFFWSFVGFVGFQQLFLISRDVLWFLFAYLFECML